MEDEIKRLRTLLHEQNTAAEERARLDAAELRAAELRAAAAEEALLLVAARQVVLCAVEGNGWFRLGEFFHLH